MFSKLLALITLAGLFLSELYGPALLMAAVGGWALYGAFHLELTFKMLRTTSPVIWLMPAVSLLSVLWSIEPTLTFRAAVETSMLIAMLTIMSNKISARYFITNLFILLAIISAVSVPFNNLSFDYMAGKSNLTGIFENKNSFSLCSAVLIMCCFIILVDKHRQWWLRWMTLPFIGLGLLQNVQSHSVAATLAMVMAIAWGGVMFTCRLLPTRSRMSYITVLVSVGFFFVITGSFIAIEFGDDLLAMVGKDATLTGRTELWFFARRIISEDANMLGVGYGAFWIIGHPMAEFLWHMEHEPSGAGFSFHNLYFEIAVELGIAGVLAGGYVIGASVVAAVKWLRADTSCESIFFFTLLVFILIIQTQGVDLFMIFNPFYALFVSVMLYSHRYRQYSLARSRPRTVVLAHHGAEA